MRSPYRAKLLVKAAMSDAINLSGQLIRRRWARRRDGSAVPRYGLLAPAWQGSLGDEAVITAAAYYLKSRGAEVVLLGWDKGTPWPAIDNIDERVSLAGYFESGGWPVRWRIREPLAALDALFVLGTDMLDGHYTEWHTNGLLTLANQAAASGLAVNLVGFSLKAAPKASVVENFRVLGRNRKVTFCLREGVSRDRFLAATGLSAKLTSDAAFLLPPDDTAHPVHDFIAAERAKGRLVLGVNLSSHVLETLPDCDRMHLVDSTLEAILMVARARPLSVILIPHDLRSDFDDLPLCRRLARGLAGSVPTTVLERPITARLVKSVAGGLDAVLSSRMHLAIASLGVGTPVACITYQGKFEGLFEHFGLSGSTITPGEAADSGRLGAFLSELIERRESIEDAILDRLPAVLELSRNNFDLLGAE